MPSGSHGGGGGGHSSGGSSAGGSGGSSHGGSSFRRTHIGFFGRRYYVPMGYRRGFSIISVFIPILIFFIIMNSLVIFSMNSSIKKIKEDYRYYQDMITYAEQNEGYITNAEVTGMFAKYDKYYLTYELTTADGKKNEGYTYSVYTLEQARTIHRSGYIVVALDTKADKINMNTDSIPLDYKDMPLSQDGEYNNNYKIKNGCTIALVIMAIGFAGCIAFYIFVYVKSKKAQTADSTIIPNTESQTKYPTSSPTSSANVLCKCKYCGKYSDINNAYCPTCGTKYWKDDEQ